MYTEQEALRIAEAAAIRGMQQGLDAGFALAARNTPIGSTRARITGIIDTLRKEGYLRAETAVRA